MDSLNKTNMYRLCMWMFLTDYFILETGDCAIIWPADGAIDSKRKSTSPHNFCSSVRRLVLIVRSLGLV